MTDAAGATSTATATVKVSGITQAPDFSFYVPEDGERTGMMSKLQNYFGMNIESIEGPSMGGSIKFDDFAGILNFAADHDSFDRLLPDQHMESYFTVFGANGEKKLIQMVIEGINDQIVAVDELVAVGEGATTGNLWTSLVSNEIDPDSGSNWSRIASVDTAGTHGKVVIERRADPDLFGERASTSPPARPGRQLHLHRHERRGTSRYRHRLRSR